VEAAELMDLLFMGTPEFAVPTVQALLDSRHALRAVVTQPDKPAGRGRRVSAPPVKQLALDHGIPCLQPATLRDPEVVAEIAAFEPEVIVVAAYGKILPPGVLAVPPGGCINGHASLLPKYRGAAPIQWAIINGERETGVTIILMDEEMDHGPILVKRSTPIAPAETAGELHDRLADMVADCLIEALDGIESGALTPEAQDHGQATFAPLLSKEDGRLDWSEPAEALVDRVRGVTPWPGATTTLYGDPLKVWRASVGPEGDSGRPGEVVAAGDDGLTVACGRGSVRLEELQVAGKRRMDASSFLRGHRVALGVVLGGEA
jgi:methionyl-tRNA formyltransferase